MKTIRLNNIIKLVVTIGILLVFCAASPPTNPASPYNTVITQYQLNNPAQQSVKTVNTILCVLALTKFYDYTNLGPTSVQINQNLCENSGNQGQQGDSSNNSAVPSWMNVTFNATRQGSEPESVDMWITADFGNGNGGSQTSNLFAHLLATSSPTEDNPYGIFSFDFAIFPPEQVVNGLPTGSPAMSGYVNSSESDGQVKLIFAQLGQGESNQVVLLGNGTTEGYGHVSLPNQNGNNNTNSILTMAYDADNLLVQNNASGSPVNVCYNRNSVKNYVYGYGVYDNNGNPVQVSNGGYQVLYQGNRGFYSYYGIGIPGNVSLTNGASITYADQDGSNPRNGTVLTTSGRMNQINAQNLTLQALNGVPILVPQPYNGNNSGNYTSDIIRWSNSTSQFTKIGTQTCNQGGCTNTVTLPGSLYGQTQFESIAQYSGDFSQSNGVGTVQLTLNGLGSSGSTQLQIFSGCSTSSQQWPFNVTCNNYIAPTNSTSIAIWTNSTVAPTNTGESITYYCVQGCPYYTMMNNQQQWKSSNPLSDGMGGVESGQNIPYITYNFDPVAYTLTIVDSNAESINNQEITLANSNVNQFVGSGPLLTLSQYDAISTNNQVDYSKLYDGTIVTSYLQWQTSNQPWSQFTGIKDSNGNLIPIGSPIQMVYNTTNDGGGSYFLQFAGQGNLQGIPGVCYDDLGDQANCSSNTTFVPQFNIPNGAELTDIAQTNSYWVKQLFVSQVFDVDTTGGCNSLSGNLTAAQALELPPVTNGWDPASIGVQPANPIAESTE